MDNPNEFVMRLTEDERNTILRARAQEAIHGRKEVAIERGNVANTVAEHDPDEASLMARMSLDIVRLHASQKELRADLTGEIVRLSQAFGEMRDTYDAFRVRNDAAIKALWNSDANNGYAYKAIQVILADIGKILQPMVEAVALRDGKNHG